MSTKNKELGREKALISSEEFVSGIALNILDAGERQSAKEVKG